jgi:hypothetical protein
MGTHNRLLRLGDSVYLEVISCNPKAVPPARPRWFGLDRLGPDAAPSLSAWVARTTDIRASAQVCSEALGNIESLSRGSLQWLTTVPADGTVPLAGAGPALIQWQSSPHPAERLQDFGLSLSELEIFHPEPGRVLRMLSSLGVDGPLTVRSLPRDSVPYLIAHIDSLTGRREL